MAKDCTAEGTGIKWFAIAIAFAAGIGIGIGMAAIIFATSPQRKDALKHDEEGELSSSEYQLLIMDARNFPEILPQIQETILRNGKITNADRIKIDDLIENMRKQHRESELAKMDQKDTAGRQQ